MSKPTLLARILDTPQLERIVPQLSPELLHRVIDRFGLERCSEFVALATPEQLRHVLDVDLWRPPRPGVDEEFDADRFVTWLEVLLDSGETVTAQQLAKFDLAVVVAGFTHHVRVFDIASGLTADGRPSHDIGGYLVVSTRADTWTAILDTLIALHAEDGDLFHRVMRGCRRLSNSRPEADGFHDLLDAGDQAMFDLGVGREQRREQHGFISAAQARAFLKMSRELQIADPIVRAYFREIQPEAHTDVNVEAFVALLRDAGIEKTPSRPLLPGAADGPPRFARMRAMLEHASRHNESAFMTRTQELGFLANVLLSGTSIQGRALTSDEASEAVAAVCSLAIENWQPAPQNDFLVNRDLIAVFQVGWQRLYRHVCLQAATRLLESLTMFRCADAEIQRGLTQLSAALSRHLATGEPWHARDALDVLTSLDMTAWAGLLALLDEFPVLHGAVTALTGS
ncbi:MAG TPA: DUF6178 family protein, partial [Vicinamibacterales bacterium]|nr:DUF6178 family protein [Vicinamibacterales bacterium]